MATEDQKSVTSATAEGFLGGFTDAMGKTPVAGGKLSEEFPRGMPLGAFLELAEAAEDSMKASGARGGHEGSIEERMERFPELRDVHLETGAAARFPELSTETSSHHAVREEEQDDVGFSR